MSKRFFYFLLFCVLPVQAIADIGFYETEPNDTPDDFHPISGEITLYGTMVGTDQDGFLWTVSDTDARKRWTFMLNGEPGALTITEVVRLNYADNGVDIQSKTRLFTMGTRDGVTPSIHENLLFEPGEYVIGLAQAGAGRGEQSSAAFRPPVGSLSFGEDDTAEEKSVQPTSADQVSGEAPPPNTEPGAYRLIISEARPIHPQPNPKGRDSQESAHGLRIASEWSTYDLTEESWYKLEFTEKQVETRWDLRVQAPIGRHMRARLLNTNGEVLLDDRVDGKGKLRFPDLAPTVETTWFLELTTDASGFIHIIGTEAVGQRVSGEEAEPNTAFNFANRIEFAETVTGRIGGDDSADFFRFRTDENAADELRTLRIETDPIVRVNLCLRTGDNQQVQCRSHDSPVELPDLALDANDWTIVVERAAAEANYTLSWVSQGPLQAGSEVEPNDLIQHAKGVPDNLRIKGRFTGDDTDFHKIFVTEEPQLWRFQVIGDEIFEVGYYDGSMQQKDKIRAKPGQRRIRLENVFLLPGQHYVRVQGRDGGEYTLLARALGPPDPNGEMEPNDQHNKQHLAIGQTRTGIAADDNDLDYYRFFVGNWDHLKLTIQPPVDGILAPNIYWYDNQIGQGIPSDTPGEAMVMQGLFPPGDYHIVVDPRQISDAEYTVSLERFPRWSCPADCEPNGQGLIWLAAGLPGDLVIEGYSGQWRDDDYYQLPTFNQPTDLHIHSAEPARLSLGTSTANREYLKHDAEFGGYKTTIPAGQANRLIIEGRHESYRVELEFPNGEIKAVTESLPANLELTLNEESVAAYRQHGQRVAGTFKISNSGVASMDLELEAVTSDYRWQINLEPATISVPANGNVSVDVDILAPADAWADPVRISARAVDPTGRQAETSTEIEIDRERLPVNPELHWTIPDGLRGGFNVAWLPFDAQWTEETVSTHNWAVRTDTIRDDLVFDGARVAGPAYGEGWAEDGPPELTLELPGNKPIPVAGMAINHFGTPGPFFDVREGTLLLSLDGNNFEEALRFEALPVETEQYFAMEQPVLARFARLRIDSTFRDWSAQRPAMAEWKVILDPQHDLSGGKGFNIADPGLGGHLVWSNPPEPYAPRGVLTPDDASKAAGMRRGEHTKEYVIAFKQNRTAQITGIDWLNGEDAREETKIFQRVEIAISMESPIGPWLPLGDLEINPEDMNGKLVLPEPAWARFVRLTAHKDPDKRTAQAPGQILIHERPQGPEYRSVLGEWDSQNHRGFYESKLGLPEKAAVISTGNTSRSSAASLQASIQASGQVALGKYSHWYRLAVPADNNTLTIAMQGDPTVRTEVELQNAAGEEIPIRRIDQQLTPALHEFEAVVEAGSEVWFHIYEPPRNVAFSWDTSASVNKYIPTINNAIVAFSGQVVPGQERVNLFPFPTGPLLDNWLGEPYMLQTILNDYRRPSSSSSGEYAMKLTGQSLAPLAGTKAIVIITDGDVPHDGAMWHEMKKAQPRVFSVHVAGAERIHQQLLRDWSMVNGGHYSQLLYDGEMEVAFDRATTLMHRPAGYTIGVESEFREAPGPGLLQVIAGESAGAGGGGVELILDASGSMLQRLDGKRRINIAKEVLTEAVTEHIPAGTPVALRVFGHKEVDSCRTDLEIPLSPLDPQAAAAKIAGINAMNLARTPIADSLRAVKTDLQGATSGVIVLVTDGEETCDGDPGAAIDSLRDEGFDVSLNIVGFAIDDVELAAQFESWAQSGGGRYFGASDQSGLSTAIEDALKVSYTVYDQGGNEIATGQVGGEVIELEQGFYNVLVRTQPPQRFEKVDVQGESEVTLELK